jgi:hypothetical protein
MTLTGDVYSYVRRRLNDPAGQLWTDTKLAPWLEDSLISMQQDFREWNLPEVTYTYYGVLPANGTVIDPRFAGLPNGFASRLQVRQLARRLSLKAALPEFNGEGMVLRPFETPVQPPSQYVWQIHQERRVPGLNGEWSVQIAEDGLSITIPGLQVPSAVEENDETLAGYISEGIGLWNSVSVNNSLGQFRAQYERGLYTFERPWTVDMQYALTYKGLDASLYTDAAALIPIPDCVTYLGELVILGLAPVRGEDPRPYAVAADRARNQYLTAAITKRQGEISPLRGYKPAHAFQIVEGW